MQSRRARCVVAVVLLHTLWPTLALAQQPKAGVVTTLQGEATVARAAVPQPIPLKFKDDVFRQDRIDTRENAVVRVLLGGKALVTIRELSTFTITEEPGRAVVDLRSGKLALGVARRLLQPGESVEVRTPNAIAAVRGSLITVKVEFTLVAGVQVPKTEIKALQVTPGLPVIVSLRATPSVTITLDAGRGTSVEGVGAAAGLGPARTLTPAERAEETKAAQADKPKEQKENAPESVKEKIRNEKAEEAKNLAEVLAPEKGAPGRGRVDPELERSGKEAVKKEERAPTPPPAVTNPINPCTVNPASCGSPTGTPDVLISGTSKTLTAGETLKTFSGSFSRVGTSPVAAISGSSVTQSGGGNLFLVESGASGTIGGPLAKITNSTLSTGGILLNMKGALTSTGTTPFIQIDPTTISTGGFGFVTTYDESPPGFVPVNGLTFKGVTYGFTIGGTASTDANFKSSGLGIQEFVQDPSLEGNASGVLSLSFGQAASRVGFGLARNTSSALTPGAQVVLKAADGSVLGTFNVNTQLIRTFSENLFTYAGAPASTATITFPGLASRFALDNLGIFDGALIKLEGSGANLTLAGGLLQASGLTLTSTAPILDLSGGASLKAGGPLLDLTNSTLNGPSVLVLLSGGSKLITTAGPAIRISGGSLTADALTFSDGKGNITSLTGPALDLTNTTVTLRSRFNVFGSNTGTDAFNITLALNTPAIKMAGSTLTLTAIGEGLMGFGEKVAPIPTEPGVAFIASGSTINLKGRLLKLKGVNSTATDPLIQLTNTTVNQTGTVLALIVVGPNGLASTMAAPLLKAAGSTINTSGTTLVFEGPGSLTSNTTLPFLSFNPSSVTSARAFIVATDNFGLTLKGSLLDATDTSFNTTSNLFSFFPVIDGASVTTAGTTAPLLKFTGTAPGLSKVTAARSFLPLAINTPGASPPSMTLSGPLLNAIKTDFKTGDPTSNTFSFMFVGDSATLTSSSILPLLSFDASSVDTAGNILTLRRSNSVASPSKLTLSGPLFSATNNSSFDTTSLGFGTAFSTLPSACCTGFFVGQGAQLSSTTTSALLQLTNSTFNAGPDAQSGGNFFSLFDTFSGAPAAELVAPASVSLSGPLLSASDSKVTALFNLLSVVRSSFTSSSTDPLIKLAGTTGTGTGIATVELGTINKTTTPVSLGTRTDSIAPGSSAFGSLLFLISSPTSGAMASDASVSLAGPFLSATNSTIITTGNAINVRNGASLTSTTTSALFQLNNSSLTTIDSCLLDVLGTGGATGSAFATVNLNGPLLEATNGSKLNLPDGGFLVVDPGGKVVVNTPATGTLAPFVSITGGTQSVGTAVGSAMFELSGRGSMTFNPAFQTSELVTFPGTTIPSSTLTLGTDKPLQLATNQVLLEASGATATGQKGLKIDNALLEATAPLLNLKAGSNFTFTSTDPNSGALDLSFRAKVTSNGPLVKLDASTLTINNGAGINVAGGSFLNVTGDLKQLLNGSTLSLLNGPALNVKGDSVVKISGALVGFGSGANVLNVTNSLCPCTLFSGIPVALQGGALSSNVFIGPNPLKNLGLGGSLTTNLSASAAVIVVTGAMSKVAITAP